MEAEIRRIQSIILFCDWVRLSQKHKQPLKVGLKMKCEKER